MHIPHNNVGLSQIHPNYCGKFAEKIFLCSFPIPHLQARLAAFLRNDLNIQLQSLDEVLTAPPNPCE